MRSSSSPAFSLVELLIVIAIIAVLIAISIPTTQFVISRAQTQTTISNLRTLQQANLLFANDNNGFTVPAQVNGNWSGGMWFQNELFLSYLGVPLTDRMWDEDWPKYAKSGIPSACPNQPPGKVDRQASIGINLGLRQHWPQADGSYADLSFNVNQIKNPSRAMAFADAKDTWIRMDRADSWNGDHGPWYNMAIAYRNGAKADGTGGKAAVVFFDGHVELLSREQVVGNWELWIPDAD
ncbi:MAG: prepilin-type N-terminal cleavage/methylation domain-containing protein [Verrucomicrobiia bacterium]